MSTVLTTQLTNFADEPAIRTKATDLVNFLNTVAPKKPFKTIEPFTVYREKKKKIFDTIDLLDAHRLHTNLKGKKNPSIKKNVPCQTFETYEEAERYLSLTQNYFDFYLHPVEPSPMDLDGWITQSTAIHPPNLTSFILPCKPELIFNPQWKNGGAPLKNNETTYVKLHTKIKIYKISSVFNVSLTKNGTAFLVTSKPDSVWLSSPMGTISS